MPQQDFCLATYNYTKLRLNIIGYVFSIHLCLDHMQMTKVIFPRQSPGLSCWNHTDQPAF